MKERIVVAFDFDGTITTKDTLLEFIKFAKGMRAFLLGFLLYSPILIAFKLKLYPNWKAKQLVFKYFFKGMSYSEFCALGEAFSLQVAEIVRPKAIDQLMFHLNKGNTVYVISASIDEWVSPWCKKQGIETILGTQVEVTPDGKLTGNFLTANCYGAEKVNRLLKYEPNRSEYELWAYGDSRGDKELIEFADKGWYNKFV